MDPNINKLPRLSLITGSVALRSIFSEVYALRGIIGQWNNQVTSGSAVCVYDTAHGTRSYILNNQWGNLGNLVHELTHVAVNEAYGADFVNYPNVGAVNVPARVFTSDNKCANEFDRQTRQMNADENLKIGTRLAELKAWAQASGLTDGNKTAIVQKLDYGVQWPHKEFDTVINQCLVWLNEWGYPIIGATKKPVVNALFEELEKTVLAQYRKRQAARGN